MLLVIIMTFFHLATIDGASLSCSANVTRDNEAAEGDSVIYSCHTKHYGIHKASLVWYKWNGKQWMQVSDIPVPTNGSLSNTYTGKAYIPKTTTLTCILCEAIPGKGVCSLTNSTCATKEYAVLYSVREISTSPVLSASPGEKLTCRAKGNPDPKYLWVKKEDGGDWASAGDSGEYNKDNYKITAELSENSTSAIYKCSAKNTIKGQPYYIESPEIKVTAGGARKRWIIIGAVLGAIAVIAIIVYCVSKKRRRS